MRGRLKPETCELCGRNRPLTYHHLIPRKVHRKRRFRTRYTREELSNRGAWLCRLCHRQLHRFFSEVELAEEFPSIEALRRDDRVQRFVAWARKQKRRSR